MRGHTDVLYIDMIAMGLGALFLFQGNLNDGLVLFAIGAVAHFAMGGFETGF